MFDLHVPKIIAYLIERVVYLIERVVYFLYPSSSLMHSIQETSILSSNVLHKITIALKFISYINSDLLIPAKKLQTPG